MSFLLLFCPPRLVAHVLAVCAAWFLSSQFAHGVGLVSVQANGSLGFDSRSAASGSVSAQQSGSNADVMELSRATAAFGVLRAYAESHIGNRGPNNISSVFATGTAFFSDDFTFNFAGLTGQSGSFTFRLAIGGTLAASLVGAGSETSPFSYAQATLGVLKDGSFIHGTDVERLRSDGTTVITNESFLNQVKTITVPFTFGTPFELKTQLQAATNSRSEFGANCIADAEHTLEWGGIASVNDSGNNALTNYTVGSTSGTNYVNAIPEPSAVTLLAFGIAGLIAKRRRSSLSPRSIT